MSRSFDVQTLQDVVNDFFVINAVTNKRAALKLARDAASYGITLLTIAEYRLLSLSMPQPRDSGYRACLPRLGFLVVDDKKPQIPILPVEAAVSTMPVSSMRIALKTAAKQSGSWPINGSGVNGSGSSGVFSTAGNNIKRIYNAVSGSSTIRLTIQDRKHIYQALHLATEVTGQSQPIFYPIENDSYVPNAPTGFLVDDPEQKEFYINDAYLPPYAAGGSGVLYNGSRTPISGISPNTMGNDMTGFPRVLTRLHELLRYRGMEPELYNHIIVATGNGKYKTLSSLLAVPLVAPSNSAATPLVTAYKGFARYTSVARKLLLELMGRRIRTESNILEKLKALRIRLRIEREELEQKLGEITEIDKKEGQTSDRRNDSEKITLSAKRSDNNFSDDGTGSFYKDNNNFFEEGESVEEESIEEYDFDVPDRVTISPHALIDYEEYKSLIYNSMEDKEVEKYNTLHKGRRKKTKEDLRHSMFSYNRPFDRYNYSPANGKAGLRLLLS